MNPLAWLVVMLLIIGALPTWPYSQGWGYYPSGAGLILLVILILLVARKG